MPSWRNGLFALMMLTSMTACAQSGQVTEKGTQKPLEGVVLVKVWRGTLPGVVQTSQKCYHLATARSNNEGRFLLPRFSTRLSATFDRSAYIEVAYKPGYHVADTNFEDRIVMERHSDSPAVRFEQILKRDIPYECPKDEVRTLIDVVLRPTHSELMELVETRLQFERADGILDAIETLTIGQEAAYANSQRRRAEWRQGGSMSQRKDDVRKEGGAR